MKKWIIYSVVFVAGVANAKMGADLCHPMDAKWKGIVAQVVNECCPVVDVCPVPCATCPECQVSCPECPGCSVTCASIPDCTLTCPPPYTGLRVKDCSHVRKDKKTGMLRGRCWIVE